MWRKMIVSIITLLAIGGIAYTTHNNILNAADIDIQVGGTLTGRVNIAPAGITGGNIGMQKGDKVLMGTKNPMTSNSLAWILLDERNYTNYDCTQTTPCSPKPAIKSWFAGSTDNIYYGSNGLAMDDFVNIGGANSSKGASFPSTNLMAKLNNLNNQILSTRDKEILTYRDLTTLYDAKAAAQKLNADAGLYVDVTTFYPDTDNGLLSMLKKSIFVPNIYELRFIYPHKDNTFKNKYTTSHCFDSITNRYICVGIDSGTGDQVDSHDNSAFEDKYLRPFAQLDMASVVFAVSEGVGSIGNISEPKLANSYSSIYNETKATKEMKLRIINKDNPISVEFSGFVDKSGQTLNKVSENGVIQIKAKAENRGTVLSAVVFDNNNKFVYYKPLEVAKGDDDFYLYDFDVSGIAKGEYKVAIVNEEVNTMSSEPAYSSLLSEAKTLSVITPLSSINVSPLSGLQYQKNVALGEKVASISKTGGTDNITYVLQSDDTKAGHENDYKNFKIAYNASNQPIVVVKEPAGLDAKDYYFKINGTEENGSNPNGITSSSVLVKVGKAVPTIEFDNKNNTIKSISDAQTSWNELATGDPANAEVKIKYGIFGGDIGLINIDPDDGEVTALNSTATGRVTIQATIDDDPSTGKDNYDSVSTTKEIILINKVDATITPDRASSDSVIPTYSATDANVKTGGTIATIAGLNGFFDNGTSGKVTYTYGLKNDGDSSYFEVNASTGVITTKVNLIVGTYTFTITAADKWTSKEIPITVNVGQAAAETLKFYDFSNKNTVITTQSASLTDTNVTVFAEVKGSVNTNIVNYDIKSGSPTSIVSVHPTSGAITIQNTGTTIITAKKKGVSGQADAYAELTFTVNAVAQDLRFVDAGGNNLPTNGDGSYQPYKENGKEKEYKKADTFQLGTSGAPIGANITYALKSGSPTDVLSVDANGLVTILNANTALQKDKVIVQALSEDPSGNYNDKTIEIPINITKGTPTISFKEVTNVVNGIGSVEPIIDDQNLSNAGDGGITVNDTQYILSVDNSFDSSIAWTNDGKTIHYDYSGLEGISVPLKVTKPGNRNFNSAEATGAIYIVGLEENVLEINTPGRIIYGDTFTIRSLQDDSSSTNVKYTFAVDDDTYVKDNTQTDNQMTFDAIKASGSNEIEIIVNRTADGELPLSKTVKVKVLPKDISIKLDNQTKKVGANLPNFTYQNFDAQLVSWNGVKDIIQASNVKAITTATIMSPTGSYPINLDTVHLNKTYPNYNFKPNAATLSVTEDAIENNWYHMETIDGNEYPSNTWVNQDVMLKSDHVDYTKLSLNKTVWEPSLTVTQEGENKVTFYMQNAANEISSGKMESVLIDKTPPKIKSIVATNQKTSKMDAFINKITFGSYFKPGVNIEIFAEDANPSNIEISKVASIQYKLMDKVSGDVIENKSGATTNSLKFQIQSPGLYKVCATAQDKAGNTSAESCQDFEVKKINIDIDGDGENDFLDPDEDGCPDINIVWENDDHTWTKLNVDRNHDNIPDLNIDSNGDGKADINIDTDDDGKPDLNLLDLTKNQGTSSIWKPTHCVIDQKEEYCTTPNLTALLNVDTGNDQIPDIDIDTDGDMKADLNISKNGKPFINIVKLHEWKPTTDFEFQKFQYDTLSKKDKKPQLNIDTDGDGKPDLNLDFDDDGIPDINIDVDGDWIPDLNIDGTGDGEADINVDSDDDGEADENVIEVKEWKPNKDSEKDGFPFDTMDTLLGKDSLEDNDIIITKPGGVFLPNFALKVEDITTSVDEIVKHDMIARAKGQIIKTIYDVKLFHDEIQVQPDGKLQIKIPIPKGIINPKLVVEQKDGTYLHVIPKLEDGYLIYESDYLGKVGVIGDAEEAKIPDDSIVEDTGGTVPTNKKNPSVLGSYTGTNTGDSTSLTSFATTLITAIIFIIYGSVKLKQNKK